MTANSLILRALLLPVGACLGAVLGLALLIGSAVRASWDANVPVDLIDLFANPYEQVRLLFGCAVGAALGALLSLVPITATNLVRAWLAVLVTTLLCVPIIVMGGAFGWVSAPLVVYPCVAITLYVVTYRASARLALPGFERSC